MEQLRSGLPTLGGHSIRADVKTAARCNWNPRTTMSAIGRSATVANQPVAASRGKAKQTLHFSDRSGPKQSPPESGPSIAHSSHRRTTVQTLIIAAVPLLPMLRRSPCLSETRQLDFAPNGGSRSGSARARRARDRHVDVRSGSAAAFVSTARGGVRA